MRKNPRTAKLDEAVGRVGLVQIWQSEEFLNPVISKLDKHVVLLSINYIASKNRLTRQMFDPLKYSISHYTLFSTPQVKHFNLSFCASLSVPVLIISSKSVASISGHFAEDSL